MFRRPVAAQRVVRLRMNSFAKLKAVESKLVSACDAIQEAISLATSLEEPTASAARRQLADTLRRVWDVRSAIHSQAPELMPEFIVRAEQEPEECAAYMQSMSRALALVASGHAHEAGEVLEAYARSAESVYFAHHARERASGLGGAV